MSVFDLVPALHSGFARVLLAAFALQAHIHLGADAARAQVMRQPDVEASLEGLTQKVAAAIRTDPVVAGEYWHDESFRKDIVSMDRAGQLRLIEAVRNRARDKDPTQDASDIASVAFIGAVIGGLVGTAIGVNTGYVPAIPIGAAVGAAVGAAIGAYAVRYLRRTADERYEATRQRLLMDFERAPASGRIPAVSDIANQAQTGSSEGDMGPSFNQLPIR